MNTSRLYLNYFVYSSISTINATAGTTTGDAWNPDVRFDGYPYQECKYIRILYHQHQPEIRSANPNRQRNTGRPIDNKTMGSRDSNRIIRQQAALQFYIFQHQNHNLTNAAYIEGTNTPTNYYYKAGTLKRRYRSGAKRTNIKQPAVMLGYAYLNARYADSPSYVNGSAPMNAPKHTANGWIYYTVDRGAVKGLSIR